MPALAGGGGTFSTSLYICPCMFVHYQTCERDILKTVAPILMANGTSGPWGKGMKQSTFGVRRSKVKVTQGQR